GFSWYSSDLFVDARVGGSKTGEFADALAFAAVSIEVASRYGERDETENYIFDEVEAYAEGEPVKAGNGSPDIHGYYTDAEAYGDEWMSGDHAHIELTDVTEYSYKAKAEDLEPNTTYHYRVGSESGEVSESGQFKTSGEKGEPFKFVHYTDTQNAFW